jgi:hypothetical protein
MTPFPLDDLAARMRRLSPDRRAQAMAYVRALEQASRGTDLSRLVGTIPPSNLSEIAQFRHIAHLPTDRWTQRAEDTL